MQHGKRSSQWDHTAAIVFYMLRAAGNSKATYEQIHPYASRQSDAKAFKNLVKAKKNG